MTGILGPRAAVDVATTVTGVDGDRVLAFQMRDGRTVGQLIAEVAAAIGVVNERVMSEFGQLVYLTDSPYAYYGAGTGSGRRETPEKVEGKQAESVRATEGGHMLPLKDFEDALGWTPLYLRDSRQAQRVADVRVITDSWWNRITGDIFRRLMTNTEYSIGSGYNVPMAIGTGVNVPFIPPQYGSYTFDNTHTHFIAKTGNTSTDYEAQLNAAVKHLTHHGYIGRLNAIVSEADIDKYMGMKNFIHYVPAGVTVSGGNADAPIYIAQGELTGAPGEVFGLFRSSHGPLVILRANAFIPPTYGTVFHSGGSNSPDNPLAIRVHPDEDFGLRLNPVVTNLVNPEIDKILVKGTHGVGTNNRLSAVNFRLNNANWENPAL